MKKLENKQVIIQPASGRRRMSEMSPVFASAFHLGAAHVWKKTWRNKKLAALSTHSWIQEERNWSPSPLRGESR